MPFKPCGHPGCNKQRYHLGLCQFDERWAKTHESASAAKLEQSRQLRKAIPGRAPHSPARQVCKLAPAPAPPPRAASEHAAAPSKTFLAVLLWAVAATATAMAATAPTAAAAAAAAMPYAVCGALGSLRALVLLGV
mgnify:FL=1